MYTVTVVLSNSRDAHFLRNADGTRTTKEYPDAWQFDSRDAAYRAGVKIAGRNANVYGFSVEKVSEEG